MHDISFLFTYLRLLMRRQILHHDVVALVAAVVLRCHHLDVIPDSCTFSVFRIPQHPQVSFVLVLSAAAHAC
jgi:hypothetical protein